LTRCPACEKASNKLFPPFGRLFTAGVSKLGREAAVFRVLLPEWGMSQAHPRVLTRGSPRYRWLAMLWLVAVATGMTGPPPAQWDARIPQGVQPSWFGPVANQPALNLHIWRAPIRRPAEAGDLAVTFVFRQVPGGFARVIWQGPGRVVTLCANLFEQAAPLHQRTILISREMLGTEGQLFVESTGPGACLEKVDLHWVEPRVLAAVGNPARLVGAAGRIWPDAELDGKFSGAVPDEIHAGFVDALLEAGPLSVEPGQGVRLLASLQGRPGFGRIRAQVSGLAPNEEPQIWVNGSPLGAVSVEVPRLDDPGYRLAGSDQWEYGGWKTLTAFVPANWLVAGENQVDWSAPVGGRGLVVRNLRLEVSAESGVGIAPPAAVERPRPATGSPAAAQGMSPPARTAGFAAPPPSPQLRTGLSSGLPIVGLRKE